MKNSRFWGDFDFMIFCEYLHYGKNEISKQWKVIFLFKFLWLIGVHTKYVAINFCGDLMVFKIVIFNFLQKQYSEFTILLYIGIAACANLVLSSIFFDFKRSSTPNDTKKLGPLLNRISISLRNLYAEFSIGILDTFQHVILNVCSKKFETFHLKSK